MIPYFTVKVNRAANLVDMGTMFKDRKFKTATNYKEIKPPVSESINGDYPSSPFLWKCLKAR